MSENKPNCYECKHRRPLAGDCHSSCAHPKAGAGADPLMQLMAIFASVGRAPPMMGAGAKGLNVKFDDWGIKNNWANWPFNFDPIWLQACDGFEKE